MYWRQWSVALLLGSVIAYGSTQAGLDGFYGIILGLVTAFLVRWFLATIGRTRYWRQRSSRDYRKVKCPNCGNRRWRRSGDWFLKCYDCGWIEGWPIVRWFTRSVPARQLRRSISPAGILIVGAIAVLAMVGSPGALGAGGVPALNPIVSDSTPITEDESNTASTTVEITKSDTTEDFNQTKVERWVWKLTNQRRQAQGLQNVSYSSEIASVAREHSRNMANNDYIGHEEPNGESGEERYSGICDFSGSGYTFGENVNAVHIGRYQLWHNSKRVYINSEREAAEYLVIEWMNSTGHRKNMLNDAWGRLGVGVVKTESGQVYASQAFC